MDANAQPVARLRWPEGELMLFPGQHIKLGRSSDNDVVLNDAGISRVHAAVDWNGGGFVLKDQGSINGTFVNTHRLQADARLLRDGDEITLGSQVFRYEIIRAEPAEPLVQPPGLEEKESRYKGAWLVVSSGPDVGQEYPLWGETITIGRVSRDATWEIRLTDRSVSRPHARLERQDDHLLLRDMGSANGTSLNGAPLVEPAVLKNGDEITIGDTCLIFHDH
jgi:ABC transport system ATP-binding/permease protein